MRVEVQALLKASAVDKEIFINVYSSIEVQPKLKFIIYGVLTDYDVLLYLARISIWS